MIEKLENENVYLRNIISTICKSKQFIAVLNNGKFIIIIDGFILIDINISEILDPSIQIAFNNISLSNNKNYIECKPLLYDEIMNKYNLYNEFQMQRNLLYEMTDLKKDKNFLDILSKKTKDGATKYILSDHLRKHCIYLFGSLLNLNKSDKIGVSIYSTSYNNINLATFHIYKTKLKLNYDLSLRYIDLIK